jgi:hypothetical protein
MAPLCVLAAPAGLYEAGIKTTAQASIKIVLLTTLFSSLYVL